MSHQAKTFALSEDIVIDSESDCPDGGPDTTMSLNPPHVADADSVRTLSRSHPLSQSSGAEVTKFPVQTTGRFSREFPRKQPGQAKAFQTVDNAESRKRIKSSWPESAEHSSYSTYRASLIDAESGRERGDGIDRADHEASRQSSPLSNPTSGDQNAITEGIRFSATGRRHQMQRSRPSTLFKPPLGFGSPQLATTLKMSSFLSPLSLLEKELWHFVLPKSLPLSAVRDINLRALARETRAFSHCEINFKFIEQPRSYNGAMHFFSPEPNGVKFVPLEMEVRRSFLVSRCAEAISPGAGDLSDTACSSPRLLPRKSKPQQPSGLQSRYHPIGCGSDGLNTGITKGEDRNDTNFYALKMSGIDLCASKLCGPADHVDSSMLGGNFKAADVMHYSLGSDQVQKINGDVHLKVQIAGGGITTTGKSQYGKSRKRKRKD